MCFSHGFLFSHAFSEVCHVAKVILGQRWQDFWGLKKRWIPFGFIYGIDYSLGMVSKHTRSF